jgi:excisionase family DNA binding protein
VLIMTSLDFTLAEAAIYLAITARHLRDLIDEGQIAAYDVASSGASRQALRIEKREADAFKARRKVVPCPTATPQNTHPVPSRACGSTPQKASGAMIFAFPAIDFADRVKQRTGGRPKPSSGRCASRRPERHAKAPG